MKFRIELLGEFRLTDLETGTEIPLRSYSQIVRLLVFSHPGLVDRHQIIKSIWPEEDSNSSRNRLRVALVRLRKIFGDALIESSGYIGLNSSSVESDLWRINEHVQDFRDAIDISTQREAVFRIGETFHWRAPDTFEELDPKFKVALQEVFRTMLDQEVGVGNNDNIFRFSQFGLSLFPDNHIFLLNVLHSAHNLGVGVQALKDFDSLVHRHSHLSEIKHILGQIRRGLDRESQVTTNQSRFLLKLFDLAIQNHPKLVREILCQPQSLPLAGANPREMLNLLERVVDLSEPHDEALERCAARLIGLRAWLNDAEGVLSVAPSLIEISKNPVVQRATWNYVSIAHSLLRDWTRASSALEKTAEYAAATGDVIDISSVLGTKALYLMHQGNYKDAKAVFSESFSMLENNDSPRAKLDYAVGFGNRCMLPVFEGDWEAGEKELRAGIEIRSALDPPAQHGLLKAALAVCYANLGKSSEIHLLIQQSLREAFEGESVRDQLLTFEFSACTLAALGDSSFADALDRWVLQWRAKSGLPRSQAENDLCKRNQRLEKENSLTFQPEESPARVGQEIVRRLRNRTCS